MTDDIRAHIGAQIRLLRRRQRRTLDDLARQSRYTKSLLSKIENGKILPSVGAIVRIAEALGTSVSSLIEIDSSSSTICTRKAERRKKMIETPRGLLIYPFNTGHSGNHVQPILYVARKGQITLGVDSHEGHEFIYVLKGTLRFSVGKVTYTLDQGDSIFFDSLEEHEGTPVTDVVEYLDIFA